MEANGVQLLPHNEEAFIKLKNCLEDNQFVAINHATGTGKSFIILKYLYENKDKRILFLSPSYPINEQLLQEHTKELGINPQEFKKLDTLIYRSLLKMDMEELANNYDIIILDEYHRCGAKKWGIKVNELLSVIKERYPNTKVVGTTATEIRYLDNERNMNNILFDGVCASTLTLADAMLREILPVPIYINSLVELNIEYEKIIKKIHKNTLYDRERDYYLNLVASIRSQIDEIVSKEEGIQKYIKRDGKHLVFSSTIDNIKTDRTLINELLNCAHNEYEVHSRRTKESNAESLQNFRYDSNPAVLYCVNILNEGVHVKGVDSIFMLRPTTSPIIFFQQLGRLLSYSRRKDTVVVFDLVNNIRNSPYIYKLYMDLYQRASELIELDPENKERYINIVKRFKIIDTTSKIYEKLDVIKKALSKDNFYKKRIDFAISVLQNPLNKVEEQLAQMDIIKYYKFITLEQFRIIKKLNINKPAIFNLTEIEFVDMLDGKENLYQKEKELKRYNIERLNDFYDTNGYFPSILGQTKEERVIAASLINKYDDEEFDESIFENKNIDNLTEYEKLVYGLISDINFTLLYEEIDKLIESNFDIDPMVISIIQNQNTETSKHYIDKIFNYIANNKTKKDIADENLQIAYTEDYKRIAKECMAELKDYEPLDAYLKDLAIKIITYINETKRMPIYYLKGLSENDLKRMRELYVKKMIFYSELNKLGYINLFDEAFNKAQMELTKINQKHILEKLIEFLKEHDGDMPSSKIDSDKELAFEVSKIISNLNEDELNLINLYRPNNRTREVVLKYIEFVQKNKRYPLITATDEEEKRLLAEFFRNEPYFDEKDRKMLYNIRKSISSKEAMQNAYRELLREKRGR